MLFKWWLENGTLDPLQCVLEIGASSESCAMVLSECLKHRQTWRMATFLGRSQKRVCWEEYVLRSMHCWKLLSRQSSYLEWLGNFPEVSHVPISRHGEHLHHIGSGQKRKEDNKGNTIFNFWRRGSNFTWILTFTKGLSRPYSLSFNWGWGRIISSLSLVLLCMCMFIKNFFASIKKLSLGERLLMPLIWYRKEYEFFLFLPSFLKQYLMFVRCFTVCLDFFVSSQLSFKREVQQAHCRVKETEAHTSDHTAAPRWWRLH